MADPTAELLVKIGTDTKQLKAGLNSAEKNVGGFAGTIKKHQRAIGMAMAAAGAAILAAGALSVKAFASMGDEVQKMALRTGFSTEALSELRHAAQLSGTSLQGLEKASRTLSGAILDAGFGLETYVRAFDKIGLSYEQLKPLSPEDQFIAVMQALAGLSDESERAALAADLFGRAGTQLLPMLANGAEGLAEMRQEAHDLGIVFDLEAANKAAAFQDAMTKLKGSVTGVMVEVGSLLVDSLKPLIDDITEVIKKIKIWADEHPGLTKVIVNTGIAIGGVLTVMGTLILLKIPALIATLFTLGKAFVFTAIPAVWSFVTALWAQVTATLAAIAATGFGIPIAIASAVAIGVLATGIALLVNNQKKQINSTNEVADAVGALNQGMGPLIDSTKVYGQESADAFREATSGADNLTESTIALREETDKLTGSLRESVAAAFLAYGALSSKRALTPFEAEQQKLLGGVLGVPGVGIPGLAHGGIVTSPTLAMVGENGPEAVVPLNQVGGVNIYFNEPVFMEREESMNKLADRIYRVIKKEQRLSFGGAYSG